MYENQLAVPSLFALENWRDIMKPSRRTLLGTLLAGFCGLFAAATAQTAAPKVPCPPPSPSLPPSEPTLTFSASGLPPGLSLNGQTGLISGTIGPCDANGACRVVLTTCNGTTST